MFGRSKDAARRRPPGRRGALLALPVAVVMAAGGLSACGGSDASEDGKVHLSFSWWGSDKRHAMTKELIAKFQAAHPDIVIEPQFTSFDSYWDRLATSVAGNNTPDVMQQDTRYVREYADRGALADLKQYMPSVIKDAQLDKSMMSTGAVDGKTYAIPTGINAFSVVVDPELYTKAGVELPDDKTWTWDDFINTSAEVTKGSKGKFFGAQNMGFRDPGPEIFARQRGESLFTPDGKTGISEKTLTDWFTMVRRMRDSKAEPPASLTKEVQTGGIDQSLLATGRGAAGMWWTNELPTLSGGAGHDLKLMRVPGEAQRPGMYFKAAMFWAVSSRSKHPEEAAQFVDFLVNDPEAAKLQLADRGLPINTTLREQIKASLKPADKQSADFLAEIGPKLAPPPPLPPKGAGDVADIIEQINEQVLFDRMTPDKAAKQLLEQMTSAISG